MRNRETWLIGARVFHAAAVVFTCMLASPALAGTDVITWPTFFRTGPGNHFVVLEELARGKLVEVQACSDSWCKVQIGRVTGFVDQANVGQQVPPSRFAAPAPKPTSCFDSRRIGYENGEVLRYCPR